MANESPTVIDVLTTLGVVDVIASMLTEAEERGYQRAMAEVAAQTTKPRALRPDTGDGQSLPCTQCGTSTPDAMFTSCCGTPMCLNCLDAHGDCDGADR